MKAEPGTYALILQNRLTADVQIGRWGLLAIDPGYYIYVGSAFGPGGLRARIYRHCRKTKPKHWHIDYLSAKMQPVGAWFSTEQDHLEHQWAQAIVKMNHVSPIKGFGCSDCTCYTHLFRSKVRPGFGGFANAVGGSVKSWQARTLE